MAVKDTEVICQCENDRKSQMILSRNREKSIEKRRGDSLDQLLQPWNKKKNLSVGDFPKIYTSASSFS